MNKCIYFDSIKGACVNRNQNYGQKKLSSCNYKNKNKCVNFKQLILKADWKYTK